MSSSSLVSSADLKTYDGFETCSKCHRRAFFIVEPPKESGSICCGYYLCRVCSSGWECKTLSRLPISGTTRSNNNDDEVPSAAQSPHAESLGRQEGAAASDAELAEAEISKRPTPSEMRSDRLQQFFRSLLGPKSQTVVMATSSIRRPIPSQDRSWGDWLLLLLARKGRKARKARKSEKERKEEKVTGESQAPRSLACTRSSAMRPTESPAIGSL
mmetsp:Transcript_53111/g.99516  ORF Transcript_53111/g.99516 Transcript_53111/m.99516 type:complete len:215 (+) Transcript_53111:54-698(+)